MYMCFYPNCIGYSSRATTDQILSNAMVLNAMAAAIFVLIGSFRGLLNFKGNLFQYTCSPCSYSNINFVHRYGRIYSLPRYSIWSFNAPLSTSC
jgi:hypothetical protein